MYYAHMSRICYLLIQLEKLHRYVALKLGSGPAWKDPQPGDHHRVEDLEIQGDGHYVRWDEDRGVSHRHDLYLCILPCHCDRERKAVAQTHVKFITTPTCWPSLFSDEDRVMQGEGEQSEKITDSGEGTPSAVLRSFFLGLLSLTCTSARECGCLITNEQFITQEINEKIKALKGKQAFYFIGFVYKFCHLLQKKTKKQLEVRNHRQTESSVLSNQMFLTLTKWNWAGRFNECVRMYLIFLVHKCQNN